MTTEQIPDEDRNPIADEVEVLNARSEDAAILQEIADLNVAESAEAATAAATPETETPSETPPPATPEATAETPAAPPSEAPTSAPAAQVPAPGPDPRVPQPVQPELDRLREQNQQLLQQQQQYQVAQATEAATRHYQTQGYSEEQARAEAERQRDEYLRQQQQQLQYDQAINSERERFNAALAVGSQYGVDPRELSALNDRASMEGVARRDKELREIKAEMATLRQAQAPAQNFDNNQASPEAAPPDDRLLDQANGKPSSEWTDAERAVVHRTLGIVG